MGFLKDVRKLSKQAKELQKDYDPVAQMRQASAMMQQNTAQANLATTGTPAPAVVNALHDTGAMVNNMPMVDADVTVMPPGGAPFAARLSVVGHAQLAGVQPGMSITVLHDPAVPGIVALRP